MSSVDSIFDLAIASYNDWVVFRDDFQGTLSTLEWETVKDSGASASTADGLNGLLTISSAATTDNDGGLVQSLNMFVTPTTGKRFAIEGYVKVSVAAQTDFFFGLAATAATNPEATLTAASRIGFQIDDGNASILCKSTASSVETSVDSQIDAVDATFNKLAIYYDGAGSVVYYIDDVKKATITTNIPAAIMGLALFHLSGDASGTHTSIWDYVMIAVER